MPFPVARMSAFRSPLSVGFNTSTTLFFDGTRVLNKLSAAEQSVNSKMGAFVMTDARRSIRSSGKSGAPSKPNTPPRYHSKELGLRYGFGNIVFGWDPSTRSVVVGPRKLNHMVLKGTHDTIPEILEFGGDYELFEERWVDGDYATQWFRVDLRRRNRKAWYRFTESAGGRAYVTDDHGNKRETRTRRIAIAARPYMNPALDRQMPKFAALWTNALNKVA